MAWKKLKRVCVEWEDAVSSHRFYDPKDCSTAMCKTIGWLVEKGRDKVVLVAEMFDDGELRHTHTIPRKIVKQITYLEEKGSVCLLSKENFAPKTIPD